VGGWHNLSSFQTWKMEHNIEICVWGLWFCGFTLMLTLCGKHGKWFVDQQQSSRSCWPLNEHRAVIHFPGRNKSDDKALTCLWVSFWTDTCLSLNSAKWIELLPHPQRPNNKSKVTQSIHICCTQAAHYFLSLYFLFWWSQDHVLLFCAISCQFMSSHIHQVDSTT